MKKRIVAIFILIISLFNCQSKSPVTTRSREALGIYKQGETASDKLYFTEALEKYRQAFQMDTTFAMAALRIAETYALSGQKDSMLIYLKKANRLQSYCSNYEALFIRHHVASYSGDSTLADATLDSLARQYPNRVDVMLCLAIQKWERLDYDGARQMYQSILKRNPDYYIAYNNIGYLYAKKGLFKDAIDYLEKYQRLASEQLNPYDSKAEIYIAVGKYNEAIRILESVLQTKSDEIHSQEFLGVNMYRGLANAYQQLGQYPKALQIATEAETYYTSPQSLENLSVFRFNIYRTLHDIRGMERELTKIRNVASNRRYLYILTLFNIEKNDLTTAQRNYETILRNAEKYPEKSTQRSLLASSAFIEGQIAFKSGNYSEAAKKYNQAAIIVFDTTASVSIRYFQYLSEGKAGQFQPAIDGLMNLVVMNPNYAPALVALSEFNLAIGRKAEAKIYLQHFLNLWKDADPGSPLMRQAKTLSKKLK